MGVSTPTWLGCHVFVFHRHCKCCWQMRDAVDAKWKVCVCGWCWPEIIVSVADDGMTVMMMMIMMMMLMGTHAEANKK